MRQSGHWEGSNSLGPDNFKGLITEAIGRLDVEQARGDVLPFVRDPEALGVWSREFFLDVVRRVRCVQARGRWSGSPAGWQKKRASPLIDMATPGCYP